jgi:DNA polymerase
MARTLDLMEREAQSCEGCALGNTRTTLVWGSGSPDAELMFIGEAPGRKEDEGGLPFIGAAGRILDEFLSIAGFARESIYIANVLKCRPPNNRDPQPDEIEACQHWLIDQIHEIKPRIIVALGAFATRWVLGKQIAIGAVQGKVFQHDSYLIVCCYHPAAVIYDQQKSDDFFGVARTIAAL